MSHLHGTPLCPGPDPDGEHAIRKRLGFIREQKEKALLLVRRIALEEERLESLLAVDHGRGRQAEG